MDVWIFNSLSNHGPFCPLTTVINNMIRKFELIKNPNLFQEDCCSILSKYLVIYLLLIFNKMKVTLISLIFAYR